MIDRKARDRAADLVARFRVGAASNDGLDDEWPDSPEAGLSQVYLHLWYATEGTRTYFLDPDDQPDAFDSFLERVATFLRSDQEYPWPRVCEPSLSSLALALATLGASRLLSAGEWRRFREAGDVRFWPFLHEADVRTAPSGAGKVSSGDTGN